VIEIKQKKNKLENLLLLFTGVTSFTPTNLAGSSGLSKPMRASLRYLPRYSRLVLDGSPRWNLQSNPFCQLPRVPLILYNNLSQNSTINFHFFLTKALQSVCLKPLNLPK